MTTLHDVPANEAIHRLAEELKAKGDFSPPGWAQYAKTGVHKERQPDDPGWWYTRVASIFRYICLQGPTGVRRLTSKYGGKKNRGSKPERVRSGSGSIARTALQQLEKAGYVAKTTKSKRSLGRSITPSGQKFLDSVAHKVENDRRA